MQLIVLFDNILIFCTKFQFLFVKRKSTGHQHTLFLVTSLPIYKYHTRDHTHEFSACNPHWVPEESSCLFSSCNSTHTRALHLPYKCCTKPFPTWAKVQPHLMLDARSLYSVSPCEPYFWNTHNHTASVRITDVLHRETDCCHHTPYSYYVTSEIGNYIVKAMKKKPYCEDPNTGR